MTFDEIKRRQQKVAEIENTLRGAKDALRQAQEEYAEQEANKAGIVYGETKVMVRSLSDRKKGPFFVMGLDRFIGSDPRYRLAKIKKDGTPSAQGSGEYWVGLTIMTVVE